VAAVYGEPLDDAGLALFRACTGRQAPREGGYAEACCIVGVQSGKSRVTATLATHAALTGERGTHALIVGQDHRGAMRALLRYCREPFETMPAFRAELTRETADTLELRRGTALSAYPCRPHAARGLRANVVCLDELGFYVSTDGRPTDAEMLRVARGRLATTGGKLIVISSPYGQAGALYDLHRRHFGRDESTTLVWQASAPTMNPTLPADYLAKMREEDPDAALSEVEGEFRMGLSTFLDPDILADLVPEGVHEVAPESGVQYRGYVDAASGSGKDAFAVGIAHRYGTVATLDAIRAWRPPFNPSGVIDEAAELLRRYGVRKVSGDRYAPGFVSEGFRARGVAYEPAERTTSEMYLDFLPLVNSGSVWLLDNVDLLRELRGLERRRGTSGRDRIDHRPGAHDDRAVAAAGALVACSARQPSFSTVGCAGLIGV
jgi:hypothetical protein